MCRMREGMAQTEESQLYPWSPPTVDAKRRRAKARPRHQELQPPGTSSARLVPPCALPCQLTSALSGAPLFARPLQRAVRFARLGRLHEDDVHIFACAMDLAEVHVS